MSVPATFIGARDLVHCSGPIRAKGATSVFVEGKPWSCISHNNITHLRPGPKECIPHTAPMGQGSSNVFIEGLPAGRIGSKIINCTKVAQGSTSVIVS